MLVSKLHSGTSKTMQLAPVHLDLPLFWKSHCATCSPACVILHHVTGSCRGPIDWLWSPANIKGANKDAKIYVGRSTTVHNLLFCAYTLCMNYVTNTFLLVSSLVRSKQLLSSVHGQGQKCEQKYTTKNFVGFHNHIPVLTMVFI